MRKRERTTAYATQRQWCHHEERSDEGSALSFRVAHPSLSRVRFSHGSAPSLCARLWRVHRKGEETAAGLKPGATWAVGLPEGSRHKGQKGDRKGRDAAEAVVVYIRAQVGAPEGVSYKQRRHYAPGSPGANRGNRVPCRRRAGLAQHEARALRRM